MVAVRYPATHVFAYRAERNQSSGSGSPTSSAVDKSAVALDDEDAPDVDLSTLSEGEKRLTAISISESHSV
jgi:hypothetical protein